MSLKGQLKRQEGFRPTAYLDTEGVWTVGYGHTGPEVRLGVTITRDQADKVLEKDIENAISEFEKEFHDLPLDPTRQAVIVNMIFNMGLPRFLGFKETIKALLAGDYGMAAIEMLDSKWHRQVKRRAVELAKQLYTGQWQAA